jgi:N-methylhydantoinase A
MSVTYRLGIDVGGTFTDIVLLSSDGVTVSQKVLSTPPDFSVGIKRGTEALLREGGRAGHDVEECIHGATVATNAILTRTGARTGLISSRGFRDVLEIRRMRMHKLYNLNWEKPRPLVPRYLRMEVPARMDPWGNEIEALDENATRSAIRRLLDEGVDSCAVCFIHAYANGDHERRVRDLLHEARPGLFVSLSSEVLPEIREYERTSTTVINAYVQPVVSRYLSAMEGDLRALGIRAPVMVMQSNGGMMPSEMARQRPIYVIESGPAAGVTGCYHLAKQLGIMDAITFDMGGTTAKAALIEDGEIARSPEYEVGGEVSIGHRLIKGSGYLLRVPSVDLAEVGAGGGSIAWADEGGALKVGPHSAAAIPGPACYGAGGDNPTITDANVLLGLTNPESLAAGSVTVNRELAERAVREKIANRLGLDVTAAAWGIRTVANASLVRALRAVSTERGRDPRRFVLFGFGGMGPVHVTDVASELGISRVVIPPLAGVFSAVGLLFADMELHLVRTHYGDTTRLDYARVNDVLATLIREATSTLAREGYGPASQDLRILVDTRYFGQESALSVAVREQSLTPTGVRDVIESFHHAHAKTYGYRSDDERVQLVALRCVARGVSAAPRVPAKLNVLHAPGWKGPRGDRRAYFGPEAGWATVPVIGRHDLRETAQAGPLLVEEESTLTVIPVGWRASVDQLFNIVLEASGQR